MENCSTNIDIHLGMGTTQDERFLNALHTHYFLIDERKEVDYIEFAIKLSKFIKFYNESNLENSDWSTFFEWESTSILVNLFLWDIYKVQEDYKVVKENIRLFQDADVNVVQDTCKLELNTFFEKIKVQFEKFNSKITQLDDAIVAKSYLLDTSYLIISNTNDGSGILETILSDIKSSSLTENPIKSLTSKYQFDKNVQKLIGLLFNWKQISGESVENQLKNYSSHTPHYTLFLAFLKQLGVAQEHLNQFTKRHLDFYYKDILRVKPADASPDYVHLLLEPKSESINLSLPKESVFLAGKNSLGKNKFYKSTSELAINNIQLEYFNSTYIKNNTRSKAELINLNETNKSFNVFDDEAINNESGILIASPMLFLNGGDRYLMITLDGIDIDTSKYRFLITSENKCIEIFADTKNMITSISNVNSSKKVKDPRKFLFVGANEKKIIAYDPKVHTEINVNTPYPVLKIIPKTDDVNLKNIKNFGIEIKVRNCKNFVLATDTGTVDINKPFVPFGEFPKNGNGFTVCCNEFASKNNGNLFVRINKNLNSDNFNSLGLKTKKLIDGLWKEAHGEESISKGILNTNPILDYGLEDNIPTIDSKSGYYRIELNGGADYQDEAFLNNFIKNSKESKDLKAVPRIDSIYIDYDVADVTCKVSLFNPIDVFQIMPFGYQQINKYNETTNQFELTDFEIFEQFDGEIYLGFNKVEIGNSLNLLVQLSEGSSNPLKNVATLEWSYLEEGNTWKKIEINELGDETNSLIQSGLIHFTIPEFNTTKTTILPANKFWIKIIVNELDAICQFIGIHTQAFKAVLFDFENNGSCFVEHTEKDTISKLYEPLSFVKKVTQPYVSFGGKVKENDGLLYQRTSERLRHKNRAITAWDYERLILHKFPNVYRIKCLNHYRYDKSPPSKTSAGYITLIPIGKSNSKQENITWKPLVSQETMSKISQFVSEIGSPHARVMVKQPKLETIVLKFKVKYHEIPGADLRLYESKLKDLINKYLSPWSFGENEIQFANSIEIASIIQLIDDQSYVDFITNFEVNHHYLNENGDFVPQSNVKKIIPNSDYTLFVPPTLFSFPKISKSISFSFQNKSKYINDSILRDHDISPINQNYNC